MIYDVRKYQEDFDLPPIKLLQEVTICWWSILQMLISIVCNKDTTTLALRDAKKLQLILTCEEMKRIEEIIDLLKCFKARTDKLGAQDNITITLIIPTFEYFRNTLKEVNQGESSMIKSMKAHMLIKLDSRYCENKLWKTLKMNHLLTLGEISQYLQYLHLNQITLIMISLLMIRMMMTQKLLIHLIS